MSRTYKGQPSPRFRYIRLALRISGTEEDQTVKRIRLVFGSVAATTIRGHTCGKLAARQTWNHAHVEDASQQLEALFTPMSDHRGLEIFAAAFVVTSYDSFGLILSQIGIPMRHGITP